jgi:DNA-binding NtrC family response regulator
METLETNIFIVDNNQRLVTALKEYLQRRFGESIHISTFNDGESCLKKVDEKPDIVFLDSSQKDGHGVDILKSIKAINPKTEVIMLSKNEDVAEAIESFKAGATDYVVKGKHSWNRITHWVSYIVTEPIRIMEREFSISKYFAIFLLSFATVGIAVLVVLLMMKR